MTKLPINYITTELKAFRNAIKEGDLDLADTCLSFLKGTIMDSLEAELDQAYQTQEEKVGA